MAALGTNLVRVIGRRMVSLCERFFQTFQVGLKIVQFGLLQSQLLPVVRLFRLCHLFLILRCFESCLELRQHLLNAFALGRRIFGLADEILVLLDVAN